MNAESQNNIEFGELRTFSNEEGEHNQQVNSHEETLESIRSWLTTQAARTLKVDPGEIDFHKDLTEYGLDSADAVFLTGDLGDWLGIEVSPIVLWEHPTIEKLASHLARSVVGRNQLSPHQAEAEAV